jgi:hypothetical protein
VRYFINQGLLERPIEIEIESPPPCLYCGTPVTRPSMDGPLVCGPCDMGRNADGSKWTGEQARERRSYFRTKINEYRAAQVPPRPPWPAPTDVVELKIIIGNRTDFCPNPDAHLVEFPSSAAQLERDEKDEK